MEAPKSAVIDDEAPMPEERLAKELAFLVENTMWVSAPEYAGWLLKRGTGWYASNAYFRQRAWKKKWVSLHGFELLSMDDEPVIGNIATLKIRRSEIDASTAVKEDETDSSSVPGFGFSVIFNSDKSPDWYFKAETDEEKANWMIKLSQVHAIAAWLSSYEKVKVLGVGAQGTVYELRSLQTGQLFALKEMEIKNEKQMSLAVSEATLLKNIVENVQHPNLMRIEKVFQVGSKFSLVFPLCQGGELYEAVVARGHFSEHDTAVVTRDLVSALHALHEHNILHLDIKPENILFDKKGPQGKILLTDFGLSKLLAEDNSSTTSNNSLPDPAVYNENYMLFVSKGEINTEALRGTFGYMAPEIILTNTYSKAADVFAAGVVLYILLCGYPPFFSKSLRQTLLRTVKGSFKIEGGEWDNVSEGAKDLVKRMLETDPAKRITTAEILEHPWIMAVQISEPLVMRTPEKPQPQPTPLPTIPEATSSVGDLSTVYSTNFMNLSSTGTLSREPTVVTMPSPVAPGQSPVPPLVGQNSLPTSTFSHMPSYQPLSKENMTGALSRLANHVKTLKTTKMAANMTKFMSSAGQPGFSKLTQRFVKEPAELDDEAPFTLNRSLNLVSEDVRSAVTSSLFNLFGNMDSRLTIDQLTGMRQRLGFVPPSATANLGDILLLHLLDRDHDGFISADDMISLQTRMGEQNDTILRAVFRIYAEAVWYPGQHLNFRQAVQKLNRGNSFSGDTTKPSATGDKNASAESDWMKSKKEGLDKDVNFVEPPKYITVKNAAAIFERLGYDPSNGKKVFEILCEAVRRLQLQDATHAPTATESQSGDVLEGAEDGKGKEAAKATQRKDRMDVNDFVRAARLDNVLVQVLFRRTQKILLGICRRTEERLRAVLAENPEVKEDVVLAMLAEDELRLHQQRVADHVAKQT